MCFVLLGGQGACGILVPPLATEPGPPALGGDVLTTRPPGKYHTPSIFLDLWPLNLVLARREGDEDVLEGEDDAFRVTAQ